MNSWSALNRIRAIQNFLSFPRSQLNLFKQSILSGKFRHTLKQIPVLVKCLFSIREQARERDLNEGLTLKWGDSQYCQSIRDNG